MIWWKGLVKLDFILFINKKDLEKKTKADCGYAFICNETNSTPS